MAYLRNELKEVLIFSASLKGIYLRYLRAILRGLWKMIS